MTTMKTIPLGKTGLKVSMVGFGGIPIQQLSEHDAVAVVQGCLDLGITYFDTANGYSTSEERIGKAIAGRREQVVVATKSQGRDPKTFREHIGLSLRRLNTEYIDVLQFHNVSTEQHYDLVVTPGGLLDIAREAQAAGRIRHIGVTSHHLGMALKLASSGHFETLMFPFCVVTPEPAGELIPLCRKHDVAFIAMKPMAGGMIDNAPLAFRFLRQYPSVVPLVGIHSVSEMEQIIGVMEGPAGLDEAERAEVERIQKELGPRYCRGCDYCQPCQQHINISTVMRLRSFSRRFPLERVFGQWGQTLIADAEGCAECGDCEARCPYQLPIRDMLKESIFWYHEQMALRRPQ
jgi:uncharacterized protein